MFIRLTRLENGEVVLVNISHIYEIVTMAGLSGCELIFPHDKIVVQESLEIVEKMIIESSY